MSLFRRLNSILHGNDHGDPGHGAALRPSATEIPPIRRWGRATCVAVLLLLVGSLQAQTPPTILTFSPTSGAIGTSVTITGTHFNATPSEDIVYFGAVRVPPSGITSATTNSITLTVPLGTTYAPITVTDSATGLSACSAGPFTVTFPSIRTIDTTSLSPKLDFSMGGLPLDDALADLDGDGKPDVIVADQTGSIAVFRNLSSFGSVSFAGKVNLTTGCGSRILAIGDLDGDGRLDLVVTTYDCDTIVSVLRNLSSPGAIIFAPRVTMGTGVNTDGASISDLDADGKPELVVANGVSNTVAVFKNTSVPGAISFSPKLSFPAGTKPYGLAVADVDGDGRPDVLVTSTFTHTVGVLRNTGSPGSITPGSFTSIVEFATGFNPQCVAIGDVDSDGRPDLVASCSGANTVSILRNTSVAGSISFAPKVDLGTGKNHWIVALGDLDGDGKPDLVATNWDSSSVSVFRNTCSPGAITAGSFAPKVNFSTGIHPFGVAVGDVDGDGKPDVVVANDSSKSVSILRNAVPSNIGLSGRVFNDVNSNGVEDVGEPGLAGWDIALSGNASSGSALQFDGVGSYVDVPYSPLLDIGTAFTVALWVRGNPTQIEPSLFNLLDKSHGGSGVSWTIQGESTSGKVAFIVGNGGFFPQASTQSSILDSSWHHIAGVFNGSQLIMYLDGVAQETTAYPWTPVNSTGPLFMGHWSGGSRYFAGTIDEVNIWNIARTQTEIQQTMFHSLAGSEPGLVGYWRFNEGAGVTAYDGSGHGEDGTLLNGPQWIPSTAPGVGSLIAVSDLLGQYVFSDLPPGTYTVSEVQQQNWVQTFPPGQGTYMVSVDSSGTHSGYDFGNLTGFAYTGPSGGHWSVPSNWRGNHTPGPQNPVLIPPNTQVVLDALPSDSILALRIRHGGTLSFSTTVGRLKSLHAVEIDSGGTIDIPDANPSTGFMCYSDFMNRGALHAGRSTVTFAGNGRKTLLSLPSGGGGTSFHNLEVAGDSMVSSGNFTLTGHLILHRSLTPGDRDTVVVDSSSTSAIEDTGMVARGTLRRRIAQGETGVYRFESPSTFLRFDGGGTYPANVSVTTVPDTSPPSFKLLWQLVGGIPDTLQRTITADSVHHFSKWAFGIRRPVVDSAVGGGGALLGLPRVNRVYEITPEGGQGFQAQVRLRYEETEVPPQTDETGLRLMRGPWVSDSVAKKWNLVSLPLLAADDRTDSVFPGASSSAFGYEGSYVADPVLSFGRGYWLNFPVAQLAQIIGNDVEAETLAVNAGWNIVGTVSFPLAVGSVGSIPPGIIASNFYGYAGGYQPADSLRPLRGYWVKTSAAGKITLAATGTAEKVRQSPANSGRFSSLVLRDATGSSQRLYFGSGRDIDLRQFELPPLPPAGAMDVRYASQRMLELSDQTESKAVPILISSAVYPLSVQWSVQDPSDRARLQLGGKLIDLKGNGEITLVKEPPEMRLLLAPSSAGELPKRFALGQNYPNPFNPTTLITFDLPTASRVRLEIYDMLGRRVEVLLDEQRGAGSFQAAWNAARFASGLYFYRLDATDVADPLNRFSAVRKMLLMR